MGLYMPVIDMKWPTATADIRMAITMGSVLIPDCNAVVPRTIWNQMVSYIFR
jgi:hypothetical protein